ncbi:hypothetical protein [Pedobacter nutrimenti]|uniref:Uncharacterized protein n=1 Tax=Pedobacter nutrimenti TaxID=1241337 RepID=A0A318U6C5_9SPHI|nr:hypothetical protein [Pedobacter nutrimenti]PYF68481.1 hypothetical protein B0O44_11268 [Pedobacter nutrimenti]
MQPFDIEVLIRGKKEVLLVIPDHESHKFMVFDGDIYLGTVLPMLEEEGVKWTSDKLMADELLAQIGDKIENHET